MERATMKGMTMEDAKAYWKLVEENFPAESATHVAFQQALEDFTHKIIDFPIFLSRMEELFEGHDELIIQFCRFLPRKHTNRLKKVGGSSSRKAFGSHDDNNSSSISRKNWQCEYENDSVIDYQAMDRAPVNRLWETQNANQKRSACQEFFKTVRRNLRDDQKNRRFVELMIGYREHKDIDRLNIEVSSLFQENPELYVEFTAFLVDAIEAKSNCDRASVDDNDDDVKFFRAIKKNPHEKTLFECEDAMYAADMVFHGLESCKQAAENLLREAEKSNEEIDVGTFYTPANLRLIRFLYDENSDNNNNDDIMSISLGKEMVELLYENPVSTSWVLLSRLSEKFEEAEAWRDEFKKPWAKRLIACTEKARNYKPHIKEEKSSSPEPAVTEAETGFSESENRKGDEIFISIQVGISVPESRTDAVVESNAHEKPMHLSVGINSQINLG